METKMNMIGYYQRALSNYVNFKGRDTLPQYWWFFLCNFIISFVLGLIAGFIGFSMLGNIYSLIVLLPSLGAAVRRMHDVGKSGWFILIPIYNIILLATEGDKGQNEYGPDPRNPSGNTFDFDQKQFHQ